MYGEIVTQFARLQGDIGEIRAQLTDIQQRLLTLDSKLDPIPMSPHQQIADVHLQPYRDAIKDGVGFQIPTGRPRSFEDFEDFEDAETIQFVSLPPSTHWTSSRWPVSNPVQ